MISFKVNLNNEIYLGNLLSYLFIAMIHENTLDLQFLNGMLVPFINNQSIWQS